MLLISKAEALNSFYYRYSLGGAAGYQAWQQNGYAHLIRRLSFDCQKLSSEGYKYLGILLNYLEDPYAIMEIMPGWVNSWLSLSADQLVDAIHGIEHQHIYGPRGPMRNYMPQLVRPISKKLIKKIKTEVKDKAVVKEALDKLHLILNPESMNPKKTTSYR